MANTCLVCGTSLEAKRAGAKYCCREHKARANSRLQRSRMTPEDRKRAYTNRRKPEPQENPYRWKPGDSHKRCIRCDAVKPLDEYYWIPTRATPASYCRPCTRAYEAARKRAARGLAPDAVLRTGAEPKPEGYTYTNRGYRLTKQPGHHRADKYGYVYEHILVAEAKYGIKITRDFTVHHKNAQRGDNRPENLELRVGVHGKGGDYIDTLLAQPAAREVAASVLRSYGWAVQPPATEA